MKGHCEVVCLRQMFIILLFFYGIRFESIDEELFYSKPLILINAKIGNNIYNSQQNVRITGFAVIPFSHAFGQLSPHLNYNLRIIKASNK